MDQEAPIDPARPADARAAEGATPAMAQWFRAKAEHPDALLFFRMGDFYELFFDDAEAAATALDIALTARGSHRGAPIAMCGVPVSQRDVYLSRLIRRGFRVAIVEQVDSGEPAAAGRRGPKAPIERRVVRLVTPGTITEDVLLDQGRTSLLVALVRSGETIGAASVDVSTGLVRTEAVAADDLGDLLGRLDPAEIVAPEGLALGRFAELAGAPVAVSAPASARRRIAEVFGVGTIDAFGAFGEAEVMALAAALDHVAATHAGRLPRLARPERGDAGALLAMDASTRASLDLLRGRDGGERGSLFGAVRRTVSAAGTRMLAGWIATPLATLAPLQRRQEGWMALRDAPASLETLRKALRGAPDLARAVTRLSLAGEGAGSRASPRDLGTIRDALAVASACAAALDGFPEPLAGLLGRLDPAADLADLLARALVETPPSRDGTGSAIRPGFDGELDGERRLRDEARQVVAALQTELAGRYGVASLKVRHHNQLGYVLEAPASAVEKLRGFPELILRQGLASSARYTHPDLSDLDRRIAEAGERADRREAAIIEHLRRLVVERADALASCAEALAMLDALQSAATLAASGRWCVPDLSEDCAFAIERGRHPVVEAALRAGETFIANDADLSPERRLMLLTGPNMAGKSTFLRQNALIVILAQAGLPAPADHARIGLVDRLFSRVGAADDLAAGRSTFMVEMIEAAAILHQAGPRSFVIIDEIGRGTGTRDGFAIAQAVLEALHGTIRCRTIFATHFHDLVQICEALPRLHPCTMRVKEWRGEVVFLHEVAEGAAERSWGVHVARLAGVPPSVVRRAEALLKAAERGAAPPPPLPLFDGGSPEPPREPDPRVQVLQALQADFAALDPDSLTPRAALDALYDLRQKHLRPDSGGRDAAEGLE